MKGLSEGNKREDFEKDQKALKRNQSADFGKDQTEEQSIEALSVQDHQRMTGKITCRAKMAKPRPAICWSNVCLNRRCSSSLFFNHLSSGGVRADSLFLSIVVVVMWLFRIAASSY